MQNPNPSKFDFSKIAACLATCYVISGCNSSTATVEKPPTDTASETTDTGNNLPVLGTVPNFALVDQAGEDFNEESLDGHVTILNFFFTSCTATCPVQSKKMAEIQKQLADSPTARFVSVSVQPDVDTPEVLQSYADNYNANLKTWTFATGDRDAIWNLSKTGFMLPVGEAPQEESMPIFHSSKFVLVDASRQIRGFYESGSPQELSKLVADVAQLASTAEATFTSIQSDDTNQTAEGPSVSDLIVDPDNDSPTVKDLEDQLKGDFAKKTTTEVRDIYVPSRNTVFPKWMGQRKAAQMAQRSQFDVLHDFKFRDTLRRSGIKWQNQIVADAAKHYMAAHYDHGNGVAIADVDLDGLHDIYFTSQIGENALYRNVGDGKFEDMTATAKVALGDRISVAASFADYDNDGDADLFVTTVKGGNALYRNDGNFKFNDVTTEAGLDYTGHSSASVFFDFDRDGLLDLFVTNVGKYTTDEIREGGYYRSLSQAFSGHLKPELTEISRLYKNIDGKTFKDVTEEMNLIDDSWSGAATPIDVNEDGWPDLYTLDMQGHDEYFENIEGKGFKKRSREVFPRTSWGAMGVKVFDYNNDGRFDIYVTDMHSDMSEHISIDQEKLKANMKWPESMLQTKGESVWGNSLFEKQADGSYKEVSDETGAENYWPWGLSVGDLNADGFEDVFIASSMNFPLRYGVNSVLLNNKGKKFLDSEFILGVEPRRDGRMGKRWFELDADAGDKDNKWAKKAGLTSGKAVVWSALGSRSSVIFDFDNDGDLDIITNDFNSEPLVLTSDLAKKHPLNFLKLKLVGTKSNRDGLGAVVTLTTSAGTYKKAHDGQSGYISQSSHELYFGLGEAKAVTEIKVEWPSGTTQVVKPMKINETLTIREQD